MLVCTLPFMRIFLFRTFLSSNAFLIKKAQNEKIPPGDGIFCFGLLGQSPTPKDRRIHLRRRTWRRLFFFLQVLSLRRASDIFNAEKTGQICVISPVAPGTHLLPGSVPGMPPFFIASSSAYSAKSVFKEKSCFLWEPELLPEVSEESKASKARFDALQSSIASSCSS